MSISTRITALVAAIGLALMILWMGQAEVIQERAPKPLVMKVTFKTTVGTPGD